jgi:hypothetical protein
MRVSLVKSPMTHDGYLSHLDVHHLRIDSKPMFPDETRDRARQEALIALTSAFMTQGHPAQYAQQMATAAIFQADLELRNAQMTRLLAWLKQEHEAVYLDALAIVENTRQEFEQRVNGL